MEKAHRVSWEFVNGEILDGMCVCHCCDVKLCVNPAHLFLASKAENNADMARKGRAAKRVGSTNPYSRLVESQVIEIRERHAAGELQIALAEEFGVDPSTVGLIVRRKTWKHVVGGKESNGKSVGSMCYQSKLVESQVLEIRVRCAAGEKQSALAKEFRVSKSTIGGIIRRETWKHI